MSARHLPERCRTGKHQKKYVDEVKPPTHGADIKQTQKQSTVLALHRTMKLFFAEITTQQKACICTNVHAWVYNISLALLIALLGWDFDCSRYVTLTNLCILKCFFRRSMQSYVYFPSN